MKFYIEITLLENAEVGKYFLWKKVYQQIHLGLAEMSDADGNVPIGVSFPQYSDENHCLGCKLRLFGGDQQTLEQFNLSEWLKRLTDYASISEIRDVPENITTHVRFSRQQVKSNKERIARRMVKRKGISFEEAMKQLEEVKEKRSRAPFITMKSLSTSKPFSLFIVKSMSEESVTGHFTSYGLSKEATVPWF